jgi:ABC-type multidrug transport system permease subunit
MENEINEIVETNDSQELVLDELAISYLKETGKWTKFMSIIGFVFFGVAVICSVFLMFAATSGNPGSVMRGFPLLLMAGLYVLPIYYLLKFSNLSKKAIEELDSFTLTEALQYQKKHYRYVGILMIIVAAVYALAAIFAILFLAGVFRPR